MASLFPVYFRREKKLENTVVLLERLFHLDKWIVFEF